MENNDNSNGIQIIELVADLWISGIQREYFSKGLSDRISLIHNIWQKKQLFCSLDVKDEGDDAHLVFSRCYWRGATMAQDMSVAYTFNFAEKRFFPVTKDSKHVQEWLAGEINGVCPSYVSERISLQIKEGRELTNGL